MKQICILCAVAFLLGSCGIKPKNVDGKEGHPRTYPDVRTDPLPGGGPGTTIRR